ncbi:MAG TPA: porin family protein [Anditalea sp.]|nr:porin family protein [Anditalea sp.]
MKKLLIAIMGLFIIGSVEAQDFSIGPKVGVSQGNVNVSGDGFTSGDSKLGYHLGGFIRMGGNFFFIQPEVLYTNTGGDISRMDGNNRVTYEATFNRLDVPIMVGLKFANIFRIQAGPVANFLLSSELRDNVDNIIDPDYNTSSIGYQAGIGLDVGNMILDLKYEGPLGKTADSIVGFQTDQRQNQLILSLGIRLF